MGRRDELMGIFGAAISAVDPYRAVRDALEGVPDLDVSRFGRVAITGCGKAGAPMSAAVVDWVNKRRPVRGAVSVKHGHVGTSYLRDSVELIEASHPVPGPEGVEGAQQALRLLKDCGPDDLVVAVISGGGSALWPLPADGISLSDKQLVTSTLLACGADIAEINSVRKHLSAIKGGLAARVAARAGRVVVLVVSDVVGDSLDVIASGPFIADNSTWADAVQVIEKYRIKSALPASVQDRFLRGSRGEVPETPKSGEECFSRVVHATSASNRIALEAARAHAESLGFTAVVRATQLTGDVGDAAKELLQWISGIGSSKSGCRPVCILSGGEATVTLGESHGKGGRNQELAMLLAAGIEGIDGVVGLSCGTDGSDGPTDAAGGFFDGSTCARATQAGVDIGLSIREHDSYHALNACGDLIRTGPTLTNVMDIQCVIID